MKILHVIGSMDPAAGGPPAVAIRLASALGRAGHAVTLLTQDAPDRRAQIDESVRGIPGHRAIALRTIATRPSRLRAFNAEAEATLKRAVAESEVIHLHGVWEPLLRRAAQAAARADVSYAVCPHGMLDPWSLAQKKWKKRLALALGYRTMLDRAAFIHALNDDEAKLIEPLGLRSAIHVIPNGVFLEEIDPLPEPGTFHAMRPELNAEPYLLFLSRLHYKKGLDLLAEAYKRFRADGGRLRLVVAGPDEGAGPQFAESIRAAQLEPYVLMPGPLYGPEKWAALAGARAFVLPTRQEGFSVAVTEALASGLPVITTHDCHYPQIAEADAGRLTNLDPAAIAAAMLEVDHDPQKASQWGANGRRLIESRFTWDKIAAQLLAIYQQHRGNAAVSP